MSGKKTRFQTVVDRARQEPIPPIDVAARVGRHITAIPSAAPPVDWSLWSVAGLSVAAAAAILLISFQQGALLEDPLADWLRPFVMVMQ